MTFNKLQETVYNFASQNKILKTFIDLSDYIIYVFVVLYFLSTLIPFGSLLDALLYNLFFVLFIAAAIGKKYTAIIILLVNNIICSLNELILIFIESRYASNYFHTTSNPIWKIVISIFINFILCLLVLLVFKKYNKDT